MHTPEVQRHRLSGGNEMACVAAGDSAHPAVLLLHGFPSSARTFRDVIPRLAETAFVIAPDLPGFGASEVAPEVSFPAYGRAVLELLDRLDVGPRFIYLHDFGAPVGLYVAMQAPELVRGLIIQNANAHREGLGPQWAATQRFWAEPTPEHEAAATAHLTYEGTRDQYVAGLPGEVAARISPANWNEDWRVMNLPGQMQTQRALVGDYGRYVARFDAVRDYLARIRPPGLLLWGRHDAFFELAEIVDAGPAENGGARVRCRALPAGDPRDPRGRSHRRVRAAPCEMSRHAGTGPAQCHVLRDTRGRRNCRHSFNTLP
ncbi:alpha/beta fold hydrolase [Opitutus sp. ER46]|uniref:alpha/beta fold hydrolase n=1 Tax=Opitutus sp. ER46 TaxID=2161864 RepID=UPI0018EE6A2B|nr:alpha/beta fold hydrolase [Opitutus sp. ER46]